MSLVPNPSEGFNSPAGGAGADPLSAIMGITSLVGLGFKIGGTAGNVGASSQLAQLGGQFGLAKAGIGSQMAAASATYSGVQTGQKIQEITYEQQIEQQKRNMMELSNQRQGLENLRQVQRQASYGKAAAANQGALQTSGYGGGQGQVAAEGGWGALGLSNSLEVGRNVFDLSALISGNRISQANSKLGFDTQMAGLQTNLTNLTGMNAYQEAQLKSQQATAQGTSSLGGDIMAAAPAIAKLASFAFL